MAGQRIDDHKSWMGKGGAYPLPDGPYKLKREKSAEGAGAEDNYPDTTEHIHRDQMKGESHIRKHKLKDGYRN